MVLVLDGVCAANSGNQLEGGNILPANPGAEAASRVCYNEVLSRSVSARIELVSRGLRGGKGRLPEGREFVQVVRDGHGADVLAQS